MCIENNICAQIQSLNLGETSLRELRLWKRIPIYASPAPGTLEANYPTFDACLEKNPTLHWKIFTKTVGADLAMFDLPSDYPFSGDATAYYGKRQDFFTNLAYRAQRGPVLPSTIPLCPERLFPSSEAGTSYGKP